jgi:hypothetical protein|tara:strand:- start:618 stop:860 length:243 start_codon:yes stop_codon:yes gene_type:complete
MVYKRYVKRGEKIYGPYYYLSFRDGNGEVRKKYLGTKEPSKELIDEVIVEIFRGNRGVIGKVVEVVVRPFGRVFGGVVGG